MVTVFNTCIYLYLCLNLILINSLYLNNEISVDLSSNGHNYCGSSNSTFYTEINSTLTNCLVLCGVRPICKAVNFKRHLDNFCELLLDTKKAVGIQPGCLYIDRHDVIYSERLNNSCGCNTSEVCDLSDNTCSIKECLPIKNVDHGNVLGDIYSLGSRLLITCDLGYTPANNGTVIVCQQNGQWSTDPTCEIVATTTNKPVPKQSFPATWMSTGTTTKTTTTGIIQTTTTKSSHLLETTSQTSSSMSSPSQIDATFSKPPPTSPTSSSIATTLQPITQTTSNTMPPPSITTALTSVMATSQSTTQISLHMVISTSISIPINFTTTPLAPTSTKTTSNMTPTNSISTSTMSTTPPPPPTTTTKRDLNTVLTPPISSPSIPTATTPTIIRTNSNMVPSPSITTPTTSTATTSTNTRTKTTSNTVASNSITTSTRSTKSLSSSSIGLITSKIATSPTVAISTSTTSLPSSPRLTNSKSSPNTVSSTILSTSSLQGLVSSTTSTSTAISTRVSTTAQTPRATCPTAWYKFGYACYLFTATVHTLFGNKRDFYDAENLCNYFYGSHLASVNSEEEDSFIRNKIQELAHRGGYDSYWLGMEWSVNTLEWRWTDGHPVNYTNWGPGQPEDNWENCLSLWESDGWTWHDVDCGEKALFVCKKSATLEY